MGELMKEFDEVWAVDSKEIEDFFSVYPGDVSVIPLPDKKIGTLTFPQTRIIIKGKDAEKLYRLFFFKFMKAGG